MNSANSFNLPAENDRQQISEGIDRLRQLTQLDVQNGWRSHPSDLSQIELDWQPQPICNLNDKAHIAWSKGGEILWFYQQFVLPESLKGYPLRGLTLRLALTWWAEVAEVYVNGQKVQEGDLFDHSARILLSPSASLGEIIAVTIRLVSPGHDDGALVRSRLIYESEYAAIDPGFVADELAVLQSYLEVFKPEKLGELAAAIQTIQWELINQRVLFDRSLQMLRDRLKGFSPDLKQHTIYLVGHAHLDMAWLWTVDETWKAAERTFNSVLNLQKDFPELTFCHSTPALYEWIEQNRPELFAQIQQQVQAGAWEIIGGMWIEPELNLISGEAIARQILYGQRYCQEKFGDINRVAWLPDSFGFCWQLPQLLKQGGIDYFVTQKLCWNDTTQFPYEIFEWRSPDGTQISSVMSAPIGEGIDPLKMAAYTWEWTTKTGKLNPLWLPGVGDHGGGPTRDMLEIARRWQTSPFFPNLEFTSAIEYLDLTATNPLPIWDDELYLEFHRGCYTTHADQKQQNRDCEKNLYQAELFASLATLVTGRSYPQKALETAWKKALFNQFHDILPGSSIAQVFVDADQEWQESDRICSKVIQESLEAIVQQILLPPPSHAQAKAIVVFNPSNWERSFICSQQIDGWKICDSQETTIPAIGYRTFWIIPDDKVNEIANYLELENQFLKVVIDPQTGNLSSIFDKINRREVLSAPGNQLQAFRDAGQYWDAWNIDPEYAKQPLLPVECLKIETCERGSFSNYQICVTRKIGDSTFKQIYLLEQDSSVLKIKNKIDWQERHVIVKAVFPLTIHADFATYEMPCGAIQRSSKPIAERNPREQAQWEVPALGWADLSSDDYGVSVLSDCKHGYDCQQNQIRLTLLRGSEFPDPEADRGVHTFTYAIYPHAKDWRSAQTVRQSCELNQSLRVVPLSFEELRSDRPDHQKFLPPISSFLDLQSKNLILTAFKQSEDDPEKFVLRCYECHGESAVFSLKSDLDLRINHPLDLLERFQDDSTRGLIEPWKIKSFSISQNSRSDTGS
ncbi:alpha-mannosidase [Phormidesmis priestleyi ULC007]|uniref:Alpha-mannosidase n=1 Tax=Phormidesmis priestleyi ULC007 TaxID=1920490 RepID=A0A2T1DDJ9_9CYAN|nr:alpha-mannosidase [Phormidesmis priestleyi]PSB18537.1 alpha-mannosidase [Phormidesmis priestleyi ULC007]PZO49814.1 MAG: alpha-mannosidase [Phormidesmis priestleyi]